jgi:hypothetical protein
MQRSMREGPSQAREHGLFEDTPNGPVSRSLAFTILRFLFGAQPRLAKDASYSIFTRICA